MHYKYTTKQGQFETNDINNIPWYDLHSFNDEPAYVSPFNGLKEWYFEGKCHRENGPARIYSDENYSFWLNGKKYDFKDWCDNHPNKTILVMYLLKN